jgi:hypothetical protein
VRPETVHWLKAHDLEPSLLYLAEDAEQVHMGPAEWKVLASLRMYEELASRPVEYQHWMHIDDNPSVRKSMQKRGIATLIVTPPGRVDGDE